MSDENDEKDGDPPVPTPTPAPKAQPNADDIEAMSEDELREHLRKARKSLKQTNAEAAAGREAKRKLQEIEDEQERKRLSEVPEVERQKKRIADLERAAQEHADKTAEAERRLREVRQDREVEEEAQKQGVPKPRAVAEMLRGRRNNGIDYDESSDRFLGVKEAVKKVIAEYGDLLLGPAPRRNIGTPPREQPGSGRGSQVDPREQQDVDRDALLYDRKLSYGSSGRL
jgi:hypothetical protein